MRRFKEIRRFLNVEIENYLKRNDIKQRPESSHGLWVGFLLPISLILSAYRFETSYIYRISCISSVALLVETFLLIGVTIRKYTTTWIDVIVSGIFSTFLYYIILDCGIIFSIAGGFLPCILYKHSLYVILKNCPLCFTLGEAFLITQTIALFIFTASVHSFMSINQTPESDSDIITNILEIGILSVFLVVITLLHMHQDMNLKKFSIVVISYIILMLALLHVTLQRSPILWMLTYIFTDLKRTLMIIYWAAASGLGVIAIATQTSIGSKASTARRKIFHLLSVIVYLPGLMFECNLVYLASGIALAGQIALETVRKLNLGKFSEMLDDGFYVFADEKDIGGISLTPIYLLLGIATSLFISPTTCNSSENCLLIALCGILSVGIGDTAASYFGSKYGRRKWPSCPKSLEGTMSSIICQCLLVLFISLIGFIELNATSGLVCFFAIIVNAMVEAFTDQVDNLTLPLITFIILIFA